MCLFYDKIILMERFAGHNELSFMFKNIVNYVYNSHVLLCWLILERVP
jgi:hypothetical protein